MDIKERKIIETVNHLSDDIFDFTARLVSEPSTLGNEEGATRVMAEELAALGFDVSHVAMSSSALQRHEGYAPVPWSPGERTNVIGSLVSAGDDGKSALFNGHLDVVNPGNDKFWSRDPFEPAIFDGWLHGRGAGDMKSGVAAMTYAAHAIHKAGFRLRAPFTLAAVLEEECCGNGAIACLAEGYDAQAVLIPEPFGPTILTSQLGVLWFKVSLSGKSTHVLDARGGINAIEKCYPIFRALRQLEAELNAETRPEEYVETDHPVNLNIGTIAGGDWPSTVPADASFEARLSFFPNTSFEEVRQRIETTVNAVVDADQWLRLNPPVLEFYGFRSAGHTLQRNLATLSTLDSCHQALHGAPAKSYIATCTTDLRAYVHYGQGEATCYGPVAENIHGADERVNLESIINVARTYALFLSRWCLIAEN
ncbi:ArgE/DapE family deacylase [Desulfosediminicola sp.]|uniref:ArgE/DapE family deacylase n=1 Tax=Desulfosediminicola sp. TaxID=2886825 RepID=UPI003AF1F683